MPGPDVKGMVADPAFQGLSPADQRTALLQLTGDQSFGQLSDGDTMQFISKMKAYTPPPDPGAVADAMQQEGVNNYKPKQGLPFGHYGAGMTSGDITPTQAAGGAAAIAGTTALAGGAAALPRLAAAATPYVIKAGQYAAMHPLLRSIIVGTIQKLAEGTAIAAGYHFGRKALDSAVK